VLKGFKEFIMRGNVIDLAVAVVIGTAFTAIVNTLVEKLFNPLIGALFNAESLASAWIIEIPLVAGTAKLEFGAIVAAVIQFLLIAAVVYFVFVFPMNKFRERAEARRAAGTATPAEAAAPSEAELLAEIRDLIAARNETGLHTGS
jgi:large conductance mechanosensitive channel